MSFILCQVCINILDNKAEILKRKEQEQGVDSKSINDTFINNDNCHFCLKIYSKDCIDYAKSSIANLLSEYQNYRLTTSFSPLFSLIHHYLKIKQKEFSFDKFDVNTDVALIRKVIKPYLNYVVFNSHNKTQIANSNTEVKIQYEFNPIAYQQAFEAFSHCQVVKKIGEKNFSQGKGLDKGHLNELIKQCNDELFITLIEKYDLCNLLSKNLQTQVDLSNDQIYFKGAYLKYSREIGQSPWEINGIKVCFSSVQDEIKKSFLKFYKCENLIMHAGGREDRDVRMLGSGRPMLLEVVNPKDVSQFKFLREKDYVDNLQLSINKDSKYVQIVGLENCEKGYLDMVKKYEDSKVKSYKCIVYCAKKIDKSDIEMLNNVKNLNIIQKTPVRVAHRRTLMDRKKMILSLNAKIINRHFIILDVMSSAGTYIKEFVNSDLGRTNPSLVSLLKCDCDILQLDVTNIVIDL